jgi:hypothetical protein
MSCVASSKEATLTISGVRIVSIPSEVIGPLPRTCFGPTTSLGMTAICAKETALVDVSGNAVEALIKVFFTDAGGVVQNARS